MAEKDKPQSFANHARLDPPFHFFLLPLLLITFILCIWNAVEWPRALSTWILLLLTIAAILTAGKARAYALKAQDRVIRLEERLRIGQLLPTPLSARALALTESQLIALRFAADAELAALVENALARNMPAKDIKRAITNWRPDYFRV